MRVVDRVRCRSRPARRWRWWASSGCGKSITALAIMRLVPRPGRIEPGSRIRFEGRDLLASAGDGDARACAARASA